ncbi:MAG: N,N-dimethylformamidase beta subunit family domain-containing protein [Vicinamibacterales bacterium]
MTMIRHYATRRPVRLVLGIIAAIVLLHGRGSGRPDGLLAQANPIVAENLLTGSPNWDIGGAGESTIQGFAADMSVNKGQTVNFKITSAGPFTIDVYRLGYYQGLGARLVGSSSSTIPEVTLTPEQITAAQNQPACVADEATGNYDCGNWGVTGSWSSAGVTSGVFVAKLTRTTGTLGSSHIVFLVRDDARTADLLMQTADTTWQAYNKYGGASLYCAPGDDIGGTGMSNAGSAYNNSCARRAVKVSYNRPIDTRGHSPQSFLFSAEYPMLRFLEANGYDVKYWSGVDTDRLGAALSGSGKPKVFVSAGHDEYWSADQRARVEAARDAGVSLAFFSGNEVYWKTRYEPSIDGTNTAYRTLVSYKDTLAGVKIDPTPNVATGTWRDTRFGPPNDGGRPENALIGAIWTVNSNLAGPTAITVPASMAGLRIWRNTRVANLTTGVATFPDGTLGYEWGEDLDNGFRPGGLMHLSSTTSPAVERIIDFGATVGVGAATHHLTLYRHNSGAFVFGASTVQWAWGLDAEHDDNGQSPISHTPDQAMQQATVNLLADMGAQPGSLQIGADATRPLAATAASADIFAPTSTITSPAAGTQVESGTAITIGGTAADTGGGTVAAVEVSVDAGLTWHQAQGTSNWSYQWAPGAVGPANLRVRAVDDTGNLESAGPGITVNVIVGECPCTSLWKPSVVPLNPSAADSGEYELGVKLTSDIDGFITGLRFYKGPANTGTHIGNLWTAGGALLATAVFTNETATGWQQVSFGSPVAITANTTYVASYHTPNGGYAYDPAYFTTARNAAPLHAASSASVGGNGVYSPGGVAFPTQTFNANNYWVDVVFADTLEDSTAPVISAVKATTIDSSRVTVTWTTDEVSNSRIDYGTDPAILTASLSSLPPGTVTVTKSSFVTQHSVALTGLQPNTTYYQLVSSTDASGNTATMAPPTFTVPGPTLRDTASSDFAAGTTGTTTYVSQTADGEVMLAPTAAAEFSGPALPQGWIETPWDPSGYSTIVDGILLVDGARVATCATDVNGACLPETTTSTPSAIHTAPRSLEFSANFSGDSFQHAGFAVTFGSASEPWAIFSTLSGGMLFARTNTGNGAIDTPIGVGPLGEFHRYRIDWNPTSVDYYVDGVLAVSHPVTLAGPMRPVAASDFNPYGGIVFVDWMRLSPSASPGAFESRVFDASSAVDWKSIQWTAQADAGTSLAISVRTGNSPTPDGTWSAFVPVAGPGPLNLNARYIQYRADMASSHPINTPILEDIIISTSSAPVAMPDSVAVAKNGIYTFPPTGPGSLTANDTDADAADTLRVVAVTVPAHGTAVVNADGSVNYTPVANYFGPDAFTYVVSDGMLTASAAVTIDVRDGNVPPVGFGDFFAVNEDTTLVVPAPGILNNDTDAENNALTAVLVTLPAHGMLTLGANGAFNYTPASNYAGPDVFTYRPYDGIDNGTIATVQILVNQVNDPPITEADAFNAMLNQPLDVPAPGVLANDHDVEVEDTAPMHVQLVSGVSNGTLALNTDGSFSYVPNADFLGTDSFTYAAVDHFNAVSLTPKTVTLTVAIKAITQAVASGTVSTGTGVSAGDPLNTAVTTTTAATVAIAQGVIADSQSPSGYTFLNQQVNITVTDPAGAEVTATTANPLVFTFEIDMSLIPAGQTAQTFEIFRNNVRVPNCLGATSIPAANLDPCVSERSNGTKVKLTVLTTHASHWNLGMEATPGNDLFALNDGPYLANYETALIVPAAGVLSNDLGPTSLSAVLYGTPVGGTVALAPSGAFVFTPAAGFCGTASFTYELHKSPTEFDTATATIVVDCVPVAGNDSTTVLEDSGASTLTVLSNDSDPDAGQTLTVTGVTQGANGSVAIVGGMAVSYTPAANYFGSDSFTYTISDGHGGSATGTVAMTVVPVNDVPSFQLNSDQTVPEDAGPQTVNGLGSAMNAGPANESGQTMAFVVTNTNTALFAVQPAVSAGGVLTYTPAADANGLATVTVQLRDDGGTLNGGLDTSAAQTFTISVTGVNDAPSFTKGADQTLFEDTGAQTVAGWAAAISAGPADEAGQVLTFNVGNDNNALFVVQPAVSANGTLTYDPAPNAVGVATVTVSLSDNGGIATGGANTSAPQTFAITLNLVNDAPSFTKGTDQTVLEDSAAATVANWATGISAGPADEAGQTMNFIVTNSNNALFSVQPSVSAAGTLTYTAAANANGSATVTVQLHDDGGVLNGGADTSAAQTFMIHLTAVNDAPSFTKGANQAAWVNAGLQTVPGWATALSTGPSNESGQALSFSLTNTNTALFAGQPAVDGAGTLTYTPAPYMTGVATVTVFAQDNGGVANGGSDRSAPQTFTITVAPGVTATTVASSNLTSLFRVPLTFTATVATVAPSGGVATGTVTFMDGATVIGSGLLNASGVATLTTSTLAVGSHSITAVYAGTTNYLPSGSPAITQAIAPSATLNVNFSIHALQDGTSRPKVGVVPVANAIVRVYTRRDLCTNGSVVSANPKKWGVVFDGLDGPGGTDDGCPVLTVGSYRAEGVTDAAGNVAIIVPPTTITTDDDDVERRKYVVIGRSVAFNATTTPTAGDAIYAAYTVPTVSADAVRRVKLHEIRLFNGKRVPGKSLEEYGSYLAIVEPEYLEWTSDQELYPFVLVAEGDWGVTTAVEPPAGFVADYPELAALVQDNIDALQFTLTDIGSDWTSTKITYTIKHKGETRIRTSTVPMFDRRPPTATRVRVAASSTPSLFGVPVTLTATVASEDPGHGLPGGTVTFKAGDTILGSRVMNHASHGEVTFTTTDLAVGSHAITAEYEGAGSFMAATSNELALTITPSIALDVRMLVHEVQDTSAAPTVTAAPIANAEVRVYSAAGACPSAVPGSASAWARVFEAAGQSTGASDACQVMGAGSYRAIGTTDANGDVRIIVPRLPDASTAGYLVVARTDDAVEPWAGEDVRYTYGAVSAADANAPSPQVLLHQIRLANGTRVAALATAVEGAGVTIVEPAYIERGADTEHYPVIVTGAGDWSATTTIGLPAGVVAPRDALSTRSAGPTTPVQFAITGNGADWRTTTFTHSIGHDGRVTIREARVPVRDRKAPTMREQ